MSNKLSASQTVLLLVGEDLILRNIFKTDFWPLFQSTCAERGIALACVTTPPLQESVAALLGPNIPLHIFTESPTSFWERLIMICARSGLYTRTNLWSKMRSYYRGDSSLTATVIKRIHTILLGRSRLYKKLIRFAISTLPPDKNAQAIFDIVSPTVCISFSCAKFNFDVPLLREAKRRKVYTIGMVRSWDNLSSHGVLRIVPDMLMLQNKLLRDFALGIQAIPAHNVYPQTVGLPHYDYYFNAEQNVISKSALFKLLKLDETKKLILYGAMGEFLFITENLMPLSLERALLQADLATTTQVLYRAHPKFKEVNVEGSHPHVHIDIPSSFTGSTGEYSNAMVLMSLICHSDLIVTPASTFAIDAYVLNKPVVCVGFDTRAVPYWESVGRFYDSYNHFEAFVKASNVPIARSEEELGQMMKTHLSSTMDPNARARVLELLAHPFDGQSGKKLAATMLGLIT